MRAALVFFIFLFVSGLAYAQLSLPVGTDSLQLQQIINKSEEQIQLLKEVLKQARQDTHSLDRAARILEDLSEGIDRSIEGYEGTRVYSQALIRLQAEGDSERTFSDSQALRKRAMDLNSPQVAEELGDKPFSNFVEFQRQAVRANQLDLKAQEELEALLHGAPPGFVPKIQTQAQLGSWQASTRLSAQVTELLGAVHAMREELRLQRLQREQDRGGLEALVIGSELQNLKHREKDSRSRRQSK